MVNKVDHRETLMVVPHVPPHRLPAGGQVHSYTLSLAALVVSCSPPEGQLDGEWSGRMFCRCQGDTNIDDGYEGELHLEFWRDGTYRTWMDPEVEGAWAVNGVYRLEGDSLRFRKDGLDSTWLGASILLMTQDSMVIEESPEKGCICTSHLHREKQP